VAGNRYQVARSRFGLARMASEQRSAFARENHLGARVEMDDHDSVVWCVVARSGRSMESAMEIHVYLGMYLSMIRYRTCCLERAEEETLQTIICTSKIDR
jgi:hypothetical protein